MKASPLLTISIVSHGQEAILRPLLEQLAKLAEKMPMRVLVTLNLPCDMAKSWHAIPLDVTYIENSSPKGFGANHNAAFEYCDTPYFCVMNPDVRLSDDPFTILIGCLKSHPGVVGPVVRAPNGSVEDSARRVPSVGRMIRRFIFRPEPPDYPNEVTQQVDWVAGMFMVFDSRAYRDISGFDERYHLYCEDIDICLRMKLSGYCVTWVWGASIIHDARRDSHRRVKFFWWHLNSIRRLFCSDAFWDFHHRKS